MALKTSPKAKDIHNDAIMIFEVCAMVTLQRSQPVMAANEGNRFNFRVLDRLEYITMKHMSHWIYTHEGSAL